jgi:hypothetical protein
MNLTAGTKIAGTNLVAGTLETLDSSGKLLATGASHIGISINAD